MMNNTLRTPLDELLEWIDSFIESKEYDPSVVNYPIVLDFKNHTSHSCVEIPQGDQGHNLHFRVTLGDKFFHVSENSEIKVSFFLNDEKVTEGEVEVRNGFRGHLIYKVDPDVTKNFGRLVGHLSIRDESKIFSSEFTLVVTKTRR